MEIKISLSNKPSNGSTLLRRPRPPKAQPLYSADQKLTEDGTLVLLPSIPEHPDINKGTKNNIICRKNQNQAEMILNDGFNRNDFVINPIYPMGPAFFPPGKKLCANNLVPPFELLSDEIHLQHHEHDFNLRTFQILPVDIEPEIHIGKGVISRMNYLKLTSWFAKNVPIQDSINILDLEVEHYCAPQNRVPQRQALLELQAMVNKVLEESAGDGHISSSSLEELLPKWPTPNQDDTLFKSSTSRYFCGQERSDSPFDARHQPFISPHEVAIVESMMNGGSYLSLKAHFISELLIMSPLVYTLTYLNLSFNSFKIFPTEIFELQSLMFLTMRNNPLRQIPSEIRSLQTLQFLCLSFCTISELPSGLFDLGNLIDLDVSYNNLCLLSRDLSKLKDLRKLNIEGNQLVGLPCTILPLFLSHIILGNNFMHPILWKENTRNQPQSLVDLCCVVLGNIGDSQLLPSLTEIFHRSSNGSCDECGNTVFGYGLRVIRGVEHSHYRVKNLPFIFTVCSPKCCSFLKKKSPKYWLKE